MKARSLPLKLNLISLAFSMSLAVIMITVGGGMLYRQQTQNAVFRAQFAANELSDRAERLLSLGLRFEDFLGFEDQCKEIVSDDPLLSAAALFDTAGNILFQGGGRISPSLSAAVTAEDGRDVRQSGRDRFVVHPVGIIDAQPVGYAVILIDNGTFFTAVSRSLMILVLISVFFSAVAVMSQQVIFRFTVGIPLAKLVETANTIHSADADKVGLLEKNARNDDIGRIYGALSRLMSRLNEANDRLLEQNCELDRIVKLRTQELSETNEKLEKDIERRKALEEDLRMMAGTDTLTGLPNRYSLNDKLSRILLEAVRYGRCVAVCFIDLDHFKIINDTQGHQTGDRLLVEVARRLVSSVRRSDIVARLGGDEFMIILPDIGSSEHAGLVAEKILNRFHEALPMDDGKIHITASIGISIAPDDGTEASILLKNADTAMYHAKNSGRNTFQFFTEGMLEKVRKRLTIETQLRSALENDEFFLQYQPQLRADTLEPAGAEALIRWRLPSGELLAPDAFIGIAEETGLIVPIGLRILEKACTQAVTWRMRGLRFGHMGVNISPRQFGSPDFLKNVVEILERTGLPPSGLQLEITESLLMRNPEEALRTLTEFREMGILLAIDDFGTGYSSFSYLKFLPVHHLKVDKSFVGGIATSPDDARITTAIIMLAHGLGLGVVAEGVETEAQLELLRQQACDEVQGYLLSRPLSAEDFSAWCRRFEGAADPDAVPSS